MSKNKGTHQPHHEGSEYWISSFNHQRNKLKLYHLTFIFGCIKSSPNAPFSLKLYSALFLAKQSSGNISQTVLKRNQLGFS